MRNPPTIETLREILNTRSDGLLRRGSHVPPSEDGKCEFCAEELLAAALGMEWTATPKPAEIVGWAVRTLNDAPWASDSARTEHCLPLATLLDADAAECWVARYSARTIREVLPIALRVAGLDAQAERCASADTAESAAYTAYASAHAAASAAHVASAAHAASAARAASASAAHAAHAAHAASAASAARAVYASAYAASAASRTTDDSDRVLALGCRILFECHRGID
jgi:hypothetical protein